MGTTPPKRNLLRIVAGQLNSRTLGDISVPPVFYWLQKYGNLPRIKHSHSFEN